MLNGLLVESPDSRLRALRGINLQLHLAAVWIHGVGRIHVNPFVSRVVHLYQPVLDRHGYGNLARMDREHFLVSTKQFHGLEIGLELEFCRRIEAERAAECRSEAFLGLGHYIDGEYRGMRAGFLFPVLWRIGIAGILAGGLLFLVALLMLALGLQPPLLLLAVIQGRRGKSDIEISGGEIVGARIVFFRAQRFLEPFDRIRSERLDRKERARRRSTLGVRTILIEKRECLFNEHDTGDARHASSTCAEGS